MTGNDSPKKPAADEMLEETGAATSDDERGLALLPEPSPESQPGGAEPTAAEGPGAAERADEIEALRRECAELKDQLLRRRADLENYRRRVERDRRAAIEDGVAELLRSLVPTFDNLERAVNAEGSDEAVREGIALVRRDLLALLQGRGLRVLDPLGQPFDPEQHQALSHEVTPGFAPGIVVQVFGKGYLLGERLLRPALVKVAKEPDAGEGAAPEPVH